MIPSPSTLISTKSFMKLAASDRERFSLLEQPCSSSSSSMIILKRWLADNRLNRVILPYRRTKNWANKNSTCVDQKLSFFLSDQYDRNRSKDEPLESLSLYDNSNNYRDENLNVNAANCQLATAYQTNNLGDFRPENSFPRHNWVQSSMSGVVHPHMCDHGRTDFNPRNPSCVPTQHRAFPRKSAVPPFHLQACDTKVNLWTASGTQHPKPGQNARIVGEVNYGAVTSSQLEPINDS
uniref:Uncharacterized protein n=1 Tax=Romanomermis culicivorax TaxID=13658 RepID=A0A915KP78_ROMCU